MHRKQHRDEIDWTFLTAFSKYQNRGELLVSFSPPLYALITGPEEIEAEVKRDNADIYTVEGRFVGHNYESLPSGLYIIGGKKVYKF